MKIAILGGTGKEGRSLACRWADTGIEVLIGSRDKNKAEKSASALNSIPKRNPARGLTNKDAAQEGNLVVLSVPAAGHREILTSITAELRGKIVIDLVVPLDPTNFKNYLPPPEGSAAEEAQSILGNETPVVAALHHISFHLLRRPQAIQSDVLVCGNNDEAKRESIRLIRLLGMRGVDCGPITNAMAIEALTPVLLGINQRYRVKASGVKITGIEPD